MPSSTVEVVHIFSVREGWPQSGEAARHRTMGDVGPSISEKRKSRVLKMGPCLC